MQSRPYFYYSPTPLTATTILLLLLILLLLPLPLPPPYIHARIHTYSQTHMHTRIPAAEGVEHGLARLAGGDGGAQIVDRLAAADAELSHELHLQLYEGVHLAVEDAKIAVWVAAWGGLAGAARGAQPAPAARRSAQGRLAPRGRPEWAMGRCPHCGLAPLSASWPAGLAVDKQGNDQRGPVFDREVLVFDWKVLVFDGKVPVFDGEVPVFDREVPVLDWEEPPWRRVQSSGRRPTGGLSARV